MSLRDLHEQAAEAQQDAVEAASRFHKAVQRAMNDGRSAVEIADELGVSRSRVYQWVGKAS